MTPLDDKLPRPRAARKAERTAADEISYLAELAASGELDEDELLAEATRVLGSMTAITANPFFSPVEIPHLHRPARQEIGTAHLRMVKLAVPVCNAAKMRALGLPEEAACQRGQLTPLLWYRDCPHKPYFNIRQQTSKEPVTEPILDTEGNPTGRLKILGYTEEIWLAETPSDRQIAVNKRINSGLGLNDALTKGYRQFTVPFCEYIECYSQDITHRSDRYGNYCSEMQLRYVAADARAVLMHTDPERRFDQVMSVPV